MQTKGGKTKTDKEKIKNIEKIGTYDIETKDWINFLCAGVYNGDDYIFCEKEEDVVNAFEQLKCDFYYAHYGGKFDIRFVLPILLKRYSLKAQIIHNGLGCVKCYHNNKKLYEIRDSGLILPLSLMHLSKLFDVEHKKLQIDYATIEVNDELKKYLKYDVLCLYEVLQKYRNNYDKIKLTIASQALDEFKKTYNIKNLYQRAKYENLFRKSYYGGRVEVFKRYGIDLYFYDVNSMYASVMHDNFFPLGRVIKVKEFDKKRLGFYKLSWNVQDLHIPLLPSRINDKLYFCLGKGNGYYNSIEIEKAKELGYKIDVDHGYVFSDKDIIFRNFVNKFYEKKKNSTTKYERYLNKFILNSLYGKMAQRNDFYELSFLNPTKDDIKNGHWFAFQDIGKKTIWLKDKKSKLPYTTSYLSSFISSYARLRLYSIFEEVQEKSGEIYYCDTDSVVTNIKLETDEKLGSLRLSAKVDEGYFLFPKCYAIKTKDGVYLKAKGFNANVLSYEDFVNIFNDEHHDFSTSEKRLIGLLESRIRHKPFLTVIDRKRKLKKDFDKRKLIDKINTTPIILKEHQR